MKLPSNGSRKFRVFCQTERNSCKTQSTQWCVKGHGFGYRLTHYVVFKTKIILFYHSFLVRSRISLIIFTCRVMIVWLFLLHHLHWCSFLPPLLWTVLSLLPVSGFLPHSLAASVLVSASLSSPRRRIIVLHRVPRFQPFSVTSCQTFFNRTLAWLIETNLSLLPAALPPLSSAVCFPHISSLYEWFSLTLTQSFKHLNSAWMFQEL